MPSCWKQNEIKRIEVSGDSLKSQLETKGSSADAEKPARRVYISVKVTKHSTIRYSFLFCNSKFVFKTKLRFYDIRLQKYRDLEIGDRGHSRSLNVVPFDRLCMVSY